MDATIPQPPTCGMTPAESEQLMRFQGGYYSTTEAPPQALTYPEGAPPFAGEATQPMPRASRDLTQTDYQLSGGLAPESSIHPPIDNFNGEQFYEQAEQNIWLPLKRK